MSFCIGIRIQDEAFLLQEESQDLLSQEGRIFFRTRIGIFRVSS